MLFYASKIIWFFVQPSGLLILLFALGFWAYWRGRTRLGIRILLATVLIYVVAGLSPFANGMMLALEQQYSRPRMLRASSCWVGSSTRSSRARGTR
jgi:hypothetical protein